MDHHILVLALSDLYSAKENNFRFDGVIDGKPRRFSCSCIGQLEVIPQFITACMEIPITKIIIMETELVKSPVNDSVLEELKSLDVLPADCAAVTAVDFFKDRMKTLLGSEPAFQEIDCDETNPERGFEQLLKAVKEEYEACEAEHGDWKLWLDIHGGFREISMTMFALMQMLSISMPDDLSESNVEQTLRAIPVDGVYSTLFSRGSKSNEIIDRTSFYRTFTETPLLGYMNYGQHLIEGLKPTDKPPYVFISYKRGVEDKKRFAFLGKLKRSNIRYWYDSGIAIGDNWERELINKNKNSCAFIALISEKYFAPESYQCAKELRIALDNQKPIIFVSVDGFMPKNTDYTWKTEEGCIRVFADELKKINSQNNIVLTERNASIDENYTIQDDLIKSLRTWLEKNGYD